MSREAMKQALEALEAMQSYAAAERKGLRICDEAITALRERLAQPEQEPVAWYCKDGLKRGVSLKQESPEWEPLYTHRLQPLTEDEADELVGRFARYELLRAIEAAHGIGEKK